MKPYYSSSRFIWLYFCFNNYCKVFKIVISTLKVQSPYLLLWDELILFAHSPFSAISLRWILYSLSPAFSLELILYSPTSSTGLSQNFNLCMHIIYFLMVKLCGHKIMLTILFVQASKWAELFWLFTKWTCDHWQYL